MRQQKRPEHILIDFRENDKKYTIHMLQSDTLEMQRVMIYYQKTIKSLELENQYGSNLQ